MSEFGGASAFGRIGVDIGGTFTDVALEAGESRATRKLLTTSENPADACMKGIDAAMAEVDLSPENIGVIIHGTTLATNAIIERKGAVTSLLTTEGFRDTIEIGTEGRPEQYDINIIKPAPLVPRRRRFTVRERLDRDGRALLPIRESDLEKLLPALDAAGTESLAIGFLHSYVNPAHEHSARDFFKVRRPEWPISISSDISPEFREFERFSTTCANAYVLPLVTTYLSEFRRTLDARGFRCPLLLMTSSGGLATVETARRLPVRLVESGPAGGAIFAGVIARSNGIDRAISFDMGGTTAKLCMLEGGVAQTSRRFEVARVYRFRKDSGLPLRIPVIDMVEIGAGGGSIAHVDELGRIAVGPESAGSDPGPACYGNGGKRATVTDANLLIGRIDPKRFAGGDMGLDVAAAKKALADDVGTPLELGDAPAAFGVTEMVCENMASAARVHAIESGKNADGRTLIAFGGAAPLHACQIADKLGIKRILVPANAAVGSAIGFLRAPISFEIVRTVYQALDDFDIRLTNEICESMEAEAVRCVRAGAGIDGHISTRRQAYMRYQGQGHEIAVDVPMEQLGHDAAEMLQELFDAEYRKVFGRNVGGVARGEVVTWSVTASTPPHPDAVSPLDKVSAEKLDDRMAFDVPEGAMKPHAAILRETMKPGEAVDGPAIIIESGTSTVVSSSFAARAIATGDLELIRKPASRGRGG